MFSWKDSAKPLVALAPMAGVTDASYRQCIKSIAPNAIVYTEFLSSDALHFGAVKTMEMLRFDEAIERPFIVQVFGNDKERLVTACKIIESIGADGIDINMGCPAAKIVSSCFGSALIRRADLAMQVVDTVASSVKIPVSVKTRLGWEHSDELIPFCRKLVEAGAQALAIHGRTYKQKFTGTANWDPIYELKKEVSVPVLGNGDIRSAEDALRYIGNLDGIMVGRGTMGNPWLLRDISAALGLREFFIDSTASSQPETLKDRIPFILHHCSLAVKHKGEKRGIIEMRKHFAGYIRGFDGAKEMRMKLMNSEDLQSVQTILNTVPS